MSDLIAHSERLVKRPIAIPVRHLRRVMARATCYKENMKLRIHELRKAKGLTVEQLAELSGMSKSYLSEIASGKKAANSRRIDALAVALGVTPFDLIDDKSIPSDVMGHIRRILNMSEADRQSVFRHAQALCPDPDSD